MELCADGICTDGFIVNELTAPFFVRCKFTINANDAAIIVYIIDDIDNVIVLNVVDFHYASSIQFSGFNSLTIFFII